MKGTRAAIRYAKAFMQLSKENSNLEKTIGDVKMIAHLIEESRDFQNLLKSPLVSTEKKRSIFKAIFEGKVEAITLMFIELVLSQKREAILLAVAQQFVAQYNTEHNIAQVSITTAKVIDEKSKAEILSTLKSHYHFSKIELDEKVDADLIGGLVMRIGDKQLDASIRRQLTDIENELIKAI